MSDWFARKFHIASSLYQSYGLRGLLIGMVNYCSGYESFQGLPVPGSGDVPHKKSDPPRQMPLRCILPATLRDGVWFAPEAEAVTEDCITELRLCENGINPAPAVAKGKLLLLSHELSRTGAPGVLLEAAKLLCEAGYHLAVAAPYAEGPQPTALVGEFTALGIPVYLDRSLIFGRWGDYMPVSDHASPFFDTLCEKYDAVLCNSFATHNIVKDLNGGSKSVIWWLHEGSETYKDGHTALFPLPLKDNIQVYCVGRYAQKMLEDFRLSIPTRSLLYGIVDRAPLHPLRSHEKVRFVICGSIDPRKNQLTMVRAIEKLSPALREKAEFLFVGGYSDEGYYNKVVKAAENLPCVRFPGTMPNAEVLELYAASDCVALSSIDDPMPVVLTEGMMLRRIILCSERTGTALYLREGVSGFIFNPANVDELSGKIQYIIENAHSPALQAMGEAARKIYEEQFTPEVFRRNLLAAVEEALSRTNGKNEA